MAKAALILAVVSAGQARGDKLWPPSHTGEFSDDWQELAGDLAAHSDWGGRTWAKRALVRNGKLVVFLPGTFTVPGQFRSFLKYSLDLGFDTIGLDYAWAPAPDSKRSEECSTHDSCDLCMENFHELVLTGGGLDLVSGALPVFGDNRTATLKFTHFFTSGVQFIPETLLPDVDLAGPLPSVATEYISNMPHFSIERLLVRVLEQLGWSDYLWGSQDIVWSKVFVAGHSQGASHASYVAFRRPVLGALMLSGPQDMCGDQGAARSVPARPHIYGCYAADEPGATSIQSNLEVFREVRAINTTGRARNHGEGAWCPPPAHCATAVDDQLVDDAVDQCFSLLRNVLADEDHSSTNGVGIVPSTSGVGRLGIKAALSLGALGFLCGIAETCWFAPEQ